MIIMCKLWLRKWIWKWTLQLWTLLSNENKAWKKFRLLQDLNQWPLQYPCNTLPTELPSQLGAGHYVSNIIICGFHTSTVIYSPLLRFIWNQHYDQLPVGLLAQLVEHCTGTAEVMGSNPIQSWIFPGLIFTTT